MVWLPTQIAQRDKQYQRYADKCLTGSPGGWGKLWFVVYWFLKCRYFRHGQFQAIKMMSLIMEFENDTQTGCCTLVWSDYHTNMQSVKFPLYINKLSSWLIKIRSQELSDLKSTSSRGTLLEFGVHSSGSPALDQGEFSKVKSDNTHDGMERPIMLKTK